MLIVRGDYIWTGHDYITDGAVVCENGFVIEIIPWPDARAKYRQAKVVGGPESIVFPGLINPHHHGNGITSFMTGIMDDALEPWLAALGSGPPVDPYIDTLWAAIGLLNGGYTTVGIFHSAFNPDTVANDAKARIRACLDAGLRVAFGVSLMQQNFFVYGDAPKHFPSGKGLTTNQYINLLEYLTTEYADEPKVSIFAAPSGPQWVTSETWEAIGDWTHTNQVSLHTHCLESPYEAEYAKQQYGSAVTYLNERGALHEHTSLVHGVYLNGDELDLMRSQNASLITNPGSNLRLRCGISPVLHALERGITVGLGTDSCALGEQDDAFAEMRLLYYLQRGPGINTSAISWKQCIEAATVGASSVLFGGAKRTTQSPSPRSYNHDGKIKPGSLADFSIFNYKDASGPWIHPDIDPCQLMVQRGSGRHLTAVIVDGEPVWDADRGPTKVNADQVAERVRSHMTDDLRSFWQSTPHSRPEESKMVEYVRSFFKSWPIPNKMRDA